MDIEKTRHMHWVFEIIRDGIRSANDWPILKDMELFNKFLVIYRCSNEKIRVNFTNIYLCFYLYFNIYFHNRIVFKLKILILKIMEAAFRIQPATNGGTGPLALNIMMTISKLPGVVLSTEEIIQVFRCLQSLSKNSCVSIPAIDFWLLIFLKYGRNAEICLEGFSTLNNLASKYQDTYQLLTEDNVKDILSCGENSMVLSKEEVFKCQSVLEYGFDGIKIAENNSYIFLPTMIQILNA